MAEGGRPSVFVVDSYNTRPPLPPKPSPGRQRGGAAQTLLFLLVSLALCGMAIEACFIYRLYQPKPAESASLSKLSADKDVTSPTERPSPEVRPSKPAAHLTDGQDVHHENEIMAWSRAADPLLFEMDYENGSLVIQKEGFYYVYSKVSFSSTKVFKHSVEWKTKRYDGKSIPLLISREFSGSTKKHRIRSNSFLGGVFHFYKDDAIFVKVSKASEILRYQPFENIFGAYMI